MDLTQVTWRKSSRSGGDSPQCVEVGTSAYSCVAIRDSKHPDGPAHVVRPEAFRALVTRVKRGDLDL